MTKPYRIVYDLETTGFSRAGDQILEVAMAVLSPEDQVVETLEIKVVLKDGVIPSAGALMVNKINPYSKEWNSEALTEEALVEKISELAARYTVDGIPPILTAFNGESFDKHFLLAAFHRVGRLLFSVFNRNTFDPLKTARYLLKIGALKTRTEIGRDGQPRMIATQEAVAEALGIEYEGDAHRALTDVLVLVQIVIKFGQIIARLHEAGRIASPLEMSAGAMYYMKIKKKTGAIVYEENLLVFNDVANESLYVIPGSAEFPDPKTLPQLVRVIPYEELQEEEMLKGDKDTLSTYYKSYRPQLDGAVQAIQKTKKVRENSHFHETLPDFTETLSAYEQLKAGKSEESVAAELSAEAVDRANELAMARGEKRLTKVSILKPEVINFEAPGVKGAVQLHPRGDYQFMIEKVKDGKTFIEKKGARTITEARKFLQASLDVTAKQLSEIIVLPSQDSFKNFKHPLCLAGEVGDIQKLVLSGSESPNTTAALLAAGNDIARMFPEFIKPISIPGKVSEDHRPFGTGILKAEETKVGTIQPTSPAVKLPAEIGDLFQKIDALYAEINSQEGGISRAKTEENQVLALKYGMQIVMTGVNKPDRMNDKMRVLMAQHFVPNCSKDPEDVIGFLKTLKAGEKSSSLYLRYTNKKGRSFAFPNWNGTWSLGSGRPARPEDDPFNVWDEIYEVGLRMVGDLAINNDPIVIHTSSTLLVAKAYKEAIPKSATINFYLRGSAERGFARDADIRAAAEHLRTEGYNVVLHEAAPARSQAAG